MSEDLVQQISEDSHLQVASRVVRQVSQDEVDLQEDHRVSLRKDSPPLQEAVRLAFSHRLASNPHRDRAEGFLLRVSAGD